MNTMGIRDKLFDVFSSNLKLFLSKNGFALYVESAEGKKLLKRTYIFAHCALTDS